MLRSTDESDQPTFVSQKAMNADTFKPGDESSFQVKETFRESFSARVEKLGQDVQHVIEATSNTLSSFKKNAEIAFSLATKGYWVEKGGYEGPELGDTIETFMDPGHLCQIYEKYPTGPGGRMYAFGEPSYSQPLPTERLKGSPIEEYWRVISAEPGESYQIAHRLAFLSIMENRGIKPKEMGKMIARELPTRVENSFEEACDLQVQLERALISGESQKVVEDLIARRNQADRLPWLMNDRYKGDGSESSGWSGKGNTVYRDGMNELISDLETKATALSGSVENAGQVAKINDKIEELREKISKPIDAGDLYHFEGYQGSGKMYSVVLRNPEGGKFWNIGELGRQHRLADALDAESYDLSGDKQNFEEIATHNKEIAEARRKSKPTDENAYTTPPYEKFIKDIKLL
jgi:hypothetical protein